MPFIFSAGSYSCFHMPHYIGYIISVGMYVWIESSLDINDVFTKQWCLVTSYLMTQQWGQMTKHIFNFAGCGTIKNVPTEWFNHMWEWYHLTYLLWPPDMIPCKIIYAKHTTNDFLFHFIRFRLYQNTCSQSKMCAAARAWLSFCVLAFTNKNICIIIDTSMTLKVNPMIVYRLKNALDHRTNIRTKLFMCPRQYCWRGQSSEYLPLTTEPAINFFREHI